jgi:glucose/arabinose dehydrogenase
MCTPVLRSLILGALLVAFVPSSRAATLPAGFVETPIATGLSSPTTFGFAPDGRLFVAEQGGVLRVIKNGVLLPTPFLTLSVSASGERGLLGVAFDPGFPANSYVYVYYTTSSAPVHNRVSRFTANGDVAVAGSEFVLLDLEPLGATNHNGGAIHFGTDGKLYVGVGENAVGANAQTLSNRLGKILRVNADGSIPQDNPFFAIAEGENRAIWALGLRNPFTFAVDGASGRIFINDVGQSTWEEINQGVAGANYGWPLSEGPTTNPDFTSPLLSYGHDAGCAITGATFHNLLQGPQFPPPYWGAYFFADLCGGWIGARRPDGGVRALATGISRPVDLQFAADGSLYYLARGAGSTTGHVGRIDYLPGTAVDMTANGGEGPLILHAGDRLEIGFGFDAGPGGPLPSAEIYIGVLTPFGLLWLDPAQGFVATLAPAYVGPLPSFGPAPLVQVADVATVAPGPWLWLILVDATADGIPNAEYADYVLTIIE